MLPSLFFSPSHSLPLPFSSRSLSLSLSLAASPSPLLLSPVIIFLHHRQVSCCKTVALRAVCSHWRGFPARVIEVEVTVGNTIHHTPQTPPSPAATLSSFSHWINMSHLFFIQRVNSVNVFFQNYNPLILSLIQDLLLNV
ncbi:hypothetical protein ILYODFUR_029196 [Ilyodon furcidens]|uniref:Uncharacterized protein n=1 Tax=Ilyodon furcidens TaxID=33524 RepID=A0ABV0UY19_9TELE